MKTQIVSGHEVASNGQTVWVNAPDGMCVGRFSSRGIDVHKTLEQQVATGEECLACTHGMPDPEDWARFVELMVEHHGVRVPDKHRPEFSLEEAPAFKGPGL